MQALQPDGATALYLRWLIVLLASGCCTMVFDGDVLHI
jgi:hypothetical protein